MITVVDYGAGNLRSVRNTLEELGAEFRFASDAASIESAEALILPGVGHFGQLIRRVDELGLRSPMVGRIQAGVPFLGICLGLQALYEGSAEAPDLQGFGVLRGRVTRFDAAARVPQMGWNTLVPVRPSRLLAGLAAEPYVYFANSFHCPVSTATAAVTRYTIEFGSVVEQDNLFGVQFHPEKSGPVGLQIVRNFIDLAC